MIESTTTFESELRISPRWVIATLVGCAVLLFFVSEALPDPPERSRLQSFVLLLFALSVIAWLLHTWHPRSGRWFTVVVLVAIVHLGNNWLGVPGFLALIPIPVVLAAALIGPRAATVAAVTEMMLVLLLPGPVAAGGGLTTVGAVLIATWAALGAIYAVYRPVGQLGRWVGEYFERTKCLLEETRDRKIKFEQTLDDLAHANRQLALANERTAALRTIAEEAQRAKTAFVANVSHEFRTPLNMIIGLVDFMVETPEIYDVVLSPKMREDLEVVHRNCEHLSHMVNDVLDLTRTEAGRLALHRERVDLKEIVDGSVAVIRPLLEKKQLALRVTIPDHLPEVYCDRTRIQQVVLNLVSNAARFTDKGGITIEVAQQDQHVLVSVTDTGPGISHRDAERIFEPFYQSTTKLWRDRDKGGSGLGLSISQQFVKLHGGRMWLESEPGVGSTFYFQLPISSLKEHVARPGYRIREDWVWQARAFRAGRVASTGQLVKPRVIICDGTGSLYPEFVRCSNENEIELVDTRDLAQAAREFQRCPAHAIVLNTPVSDDLWSLVETACREAPDTAIIACSVPRPAKRAVDAGALGHLIKPVTRADLEKAIQALGKPVRRVLVVDDDPDVLQLFTRMLHACDDALEIVTAASGEQALEELRRMSPDLMLLDIVMPDVDGWRVLELMSQDEEIGNVPTFFVSAQDPADQSPVSKFLLATMDDGLSLSNLLRCSLEISTLLLKPEKGLDPMPV